MVLRRAEACRTQLYRTCLLNLGIVTPVVLAFFVGGSGSASESDSSSPATSTSSSSLDAASPDSSSEVATVSADLGAALCTGVALCALSDDLTVFLDAGA